MTHAAPLVPLCFLGMLGRARLASGAPGPPGGSFDSNEHQNAAKRETPVGVDGQPGTVGSTRRCVCGSEVCVFKATRSDSFQLFLVQHDFLPNQTNETFSAALSQQENEKKVF